jgi:hypothetical protein
MRAQRLFEVHFADFAETRRAVQAFARHVHFERMVGFRDHGHARALNGDAVAELHVGEVQAAGFHAQTHARVAVRAERLD